MLSTLITSGMAAAAVFSIGVSAQLKLVSDWGPQPTKLKMYVYEPKTLPKSPAIIAMMHTCGSSASAYSGMTKDYQRAADTKGYVLVYAETTFDNHCWDVANAKSLTHEKGGDSQSVANMVKHALKKYNGDPNKVFVTGSSSGAMMTNVLCATYPDLFKGGAVFSGFAHACIAGSSGSSPFTDNMPCAKGGTTKSGPQWAKLVKDAYPGYVGQYPKMQIWHGTSDFVVKYQVMGEELKQWSAVHGVQFSKNLSNDPGAKYTKMIYGDGSKVLGFSGQGVGHVVPQHAKTVLDWWGI